MQFNEQVKPLFKNKLHEIVGATGLAVGTLEHDRTCLELKTFMLQLIRDNGAKVKLVKAIEKL